MLYSQVTFRPHVSVACKLDKYLHALWFKICIHEWAAERVLGTEMSNLYFMLK